MRQRLKTFIFPIFCTVDDLEDRWEDSHAAVLGLHGEEFIMLGFTGYGHAALKVSDLERSLTFYRDRLGFAEMLRLYNDDGSVWLIYLRITDEQYLELFPGAENDRAPGVNANGVNHLCLTVDDLDKTTNAIKAAGIKLTVDIKMGLDHNRQAWIEDPDGNRIELMEMGRNSLQAQAIERLRAEAAKA